MTNPAASKTGNPVTDRAAREAVAGKDLPIKPTPAPARGTVAKAAKPATPAKAAPARKPAAAKPNAVIAKDKPVKLSFGTVTVPDWSAAYGKAASTAQGDWFTFMEASTGKPLSQDQKDAISFTLRHYQKMQKVTREQSPRAQSNRSGS